MILLTPKTQRERERERERERDGLKDTEVVTGNQSHSSKNIRKMIKSEMQKYHFMSMLWSSRKTGERTTQTTGDR